LDGEEAAEPTISVVIPCRDATHLSATLGSLAAQEGAGPPFEVVVVDASGKDLGRLPGSWRDRLHLRVVEAEEGASAAVNRNAGVAAARGSCILFIDADDTVNATYVRVMADALEAHELVCSSVEVLSLNPWNPGGTHPQRTGPITTEMSFLPFAGAGTLGIRRSLLVEIGGWDPSLPGWHEADLCWRIQLAGHEPPVFVPEATLNYRLDPTALGRWRTAARRGRTQPLLYRRYRSAGMPRESLLDAARAWYALVGGLLRRAMGRPAKGIGWLAAIRLGRLWGSLRYRVPYL
jgi:glycosyltransferase involved in cell wall biosynthesis